MVVGLLTVGMIGFVTDVVVVVVVGVAMVGVGSMVAWVNSMRGLKVERES